MKLTRLAAAVILGTASLPILAASYTVTEIPVQERSVTQFAASIDNQGLVLVTFQNQYNPPIDYRLIDLESTFFSTALTDVEAVSNQDPNLADYEFLINYVRTGTENFSVLTQQLGEVLSYSYDGNEVNYVFAFDEESENFNGFSFGMETQVRDSVAGSHIIGNTEGPSRIVDYVNDNGDEIPFVVSDFDRRAFAQVGDTVTGLLPVDATLGGVSVASNISQNFVVAGTSSVEATETLNAAILSCEDEEDRGDQPVEACLQRIYTSAGVSGTVRRSGLWAERATFWSLDVEGNIIDTTFYDTLVTDAEDTFQAGTSQALDINTSGVGVGVASVRFGENDFITTAAAVFQNGETTRLIDDDDLLPNSALNINDNDIVVGVRSERINNVPRSRMFVHDLQTNETTFVPGFFTSSGTVPRAINNNNMVIGYGDSDVVSGTSTRPTAGFLLDLDANTFTNLNTLIACDSEYNIIEAVDINDDNIILASALVQRPVRNVRGETVSDDDGNLIMGDTVVAIQLTPTGEAPDTCTNEELGIVERQGASVGLWMFAGLILGGVFRRFKKSN